MLMDWARCPQLACNGQRRDLHVSTTTLFVSVPVQLLMMRAAQGHRKFVTDLTADRTRLREFEMVGIAGRLLADKAGRAALANERYL